MKNREKNKKPHGIPDNMAGAQNNQIIPPKKLQRKRRHPGIKNGSSVQTRTDRPYGNLRRGAGPARKSFVDPIKRLTGIHSSAISILQAREGERMVQTRGTS